MFAARIADKVAITMGSRVIMCDTLQPPPVAGEMEGKIMEKLKLPRALKEPSAGVERSLATSSGKVDIRKKAPFKWDVSSSEFAPNIMTRQICVFIPGHAGLHYVTEVSVTSINTFMPDVSVVVATYAANFEDYNR